MQRTKALARILADNSLKLDEHAAELAAACVLEHFDLAPKGTLQPFIDSIVGMAKHAKP